MKIKTLDWDTNKVQKPHYKIMPFLLILLGCSGMSLFCACVISLISHMDHKKKIWEK